MVLFLFWVGKWEIESDRLYFHFEYEGNFVIISDNFVHGCLWKCQFVTLTTIKHRFIVNLCSPSERSGRSRMFTCESGDPIWRRILRFLCQYGWSIFSVHLLL